MRARAIFVAAGIFRPANSGRTEYVLGRNPTGRFDRLSAGSTKTAKTVENGASTAPSTSAIGRARIEGLF
jgi:hypothetical protein